MKHHNLKLFAKYFQPVVDCCKRSEIRLNDRAYEVGDTVTLHEGQPGLEGFEYTGRTISARISYIDDFGCQHGYVNLSLADVGLLIVEDFARNFKGTSMNEKLKRCKELRLEAKKTQVDLAKEIGVSRVYVNMMENDMGANPALLIKYWADKGYKL